MVYNIFNSIIMHKQYSCVYIYVQENCVYTIGYHFEIRQCMHALCGAIAVLIGCNESTSKGRDVTRSTMVACSNAEQWRHAIVEPSIGRTDGRTTIVSGSISAWQWRSWPRHAPTRLVLWGPRTGRLKRLCMENVASTQASNRLLSDDDLRGRYGDVEVTYI